MRYGTQMAIEIFLYYSEGKVESESYAYLGSSQHAPPAGSGESNRSYQEKSQRSFRTGLLLAVSRFMYRFWVQGFDGFLLLLTGIRLRLHPNQGEATV